MKVLTIALRWGEADEGSCHWSGRAKTEANAIRNARKAMDASYNKDYADGPQDDMWRRGPTEYEVVECIEGVNEYAAHDMLDALKMVRRRYTLRKDDAATVRAAIRLGEGRDT